MTNNKELQFKLSFMLDELINYVEKTPDSKLNSDVLKSYKKIIDTPKTFNMLCVIVHGAKLFLMGGSEEEFDQFSELYNTCLS